MPEYRTSSIYVCLTFLLLILSGLSFQVRALDPRLRLYVVNGKPHCQECSKRADQCSCRCSNCNKPYRTEIPIQGASCWPSDYVADENSCCCSVGKRERDSGCDSQLPLQKRRSPPPLVMFESGSSGLELGGLVTDLPILGETSEQSADCQANPEVAGGVVNILDSTSFDLFELFDSFMHEISNHEQDEVIRAFFKLMADLSHMCLWDACCVRGLTQTACPPNLLESAVHPANGSYLLTLQSENNNWWPLGLVIMQDHWVAVFLPPLPVQAYSFIYSGENFMAALQDQLTGLDDVNPAMFSVQIALPFDLIGKITALFNNHEASIPQFYVGDDSEGFDITNLDVAAEDKLLVDLALLAGAHSEVDAADVMALVAMTQVLQGAEDSEHTENFDNQAGVNSAEGILGATSVNGTFLGVFIFTESGQKKFTVMLIDTNGGKVRIIFACYNPTCHGGVYLVDILFGNREQLKVAMTGLISHCGSCKMSLYKKKE